MGLYQASPYTACQYYKAIGAYERYNMESLAVTPAFFEGYGGIVLGFLSSVIFIALVLKQKNKWAIFVIGLLLLTFILVGPGLVKHSYYPPEITQAQNRLKVIAEAIEEYATTNNGQLPKTLDELVRKDYIKKSEFTKNAYGSSFVMKHAGENITNLENSDILVIDSNQPNASFVALYADGRIKRVEEVK